MRTILRALVCVVVLAGAVQAQQPQAAGDVRAAVPLAQIQRGSQPVVEAKRDDAVYWNDVVRTGPAGRVRITLLDGSLLNVGAESQMQIRTHDPGAQTTELDLAYGRLRANVVKLAKPGAGFRVRTRTAHAGVVGTRFVIRVFPDFTEVLCLEGLVKVRNVVESIVGEVTLRPGEFTRVFRGQPPSPPEPATEAQRREAEQETDLPFEAELSRVEMSWPPAGCGERADVLLRGWTKQRQGDQEVETQIDSELITGSLRLGAETLYVEGGRAILASAPSSSPPEGAFTPAGRAAPVATKIYPPLKLTEGEGWRAPRAVFAGSAFYVLGPMGFAGAPSFSFGGQPATLLWQSPCGGGFLAPRLPGREYDVTLSLGRVEVAKGKMNLVDVSYRLPVPPAVLRGQQTSFGMDLKGLEGLERFTGGRPILVVQLVNQTTAIIGNLRTATPGGKASGETVTYVVSGSMASAAGGVRLDATAQGRMAGTFDIAVKLDLDDALEQPRTPLAPMPKP